MTECTSHDIVGFDLGHGETAVARVSAGTDSEPELLELYGRKSQLTAIGRHPSLGVLIGERALLADDVSHFDICFKRRPTNDPLYRRNMRDYLAECHRHLVDTKQVTTGKNDVFLVGCPSGWSDETIRAYQNLLAESGVAGLSCVRESRAALLHAKEGGKLTLGELKQPVLIVDLGSSTIDFTLVRGASEAPMDCGDDLGASLIDKAILSDTLASHEQSARLAEVFERYPLHRSRCEMICRKAKEIYFSDEALYADPRSCVRAGYERIQDLCLFEPMLNGTAMQAILNRPLETLGGRSWMRRFEEILNQVNRQLQSDGLLPNVILLTGGASRMSFVRQMCESVFSGAHVRRDSEPEFCIARGLARWGRVEARSRQFLGEVRGFLDTELPSLLEGNQRLLGDKLSRKLAKPFIDSVIRRALLDWRSGEVRIIAHLEAHVRALATKWAQGDDIVGLVASACNDWLEPIRRTINARTGDICQRHRMPVGVLVLPPTMDTSTMNLESIHGTLSSKTSTGKHVVTVVSGLVVASLLGGGGTALLMSGPVGWCIGLVIGAVAAKYGFSETERRVRQLDVPRVMRPMLLWESMVDARCRQIEPQLQQALFDRFSDMKSQFNEVSCTLRRQLEDELYAKADEARLLIR